MEIKIYQQKTVLSLGIYCWTTFQKEGLLLLWNVLKVVCKPRGYLYNFYRGNGLRIAKILLRKMNFMKSREIKIVMFRGILVYKCNKGNLKMEIIYYRKGIN